MARSTSWAPSSTGWAGSPRPLGALELLYEVSDWLEAAIENHPPAGGGSEPPVLTGEGLGEALSWLASLQPDKRILLFQTVRELLFNG